LKIPDEEGVVKDVDDIVGDGDRIEDPWLLVELVVGVVRPLLGILSEERGDRGRVGLPSATSLFDRECFDAGLSS